jgi:hypothetical protein
VWIDVFHNDRCIEFIQFKRWLENLYTSHRNDKNSILELDFKYEHNSSSGTFKLNLETVCIVLYLIINFNHKK